MLESFKSVTLVNNCQSIKKRKETILSLWECSTQRLQQITPIKEQKLGEHGDMKAKERINDIKFWTDIDN